MGESHGVGWEAGKEGQRDTFIYISGLQGDHGFRRPGSSQVRGRSESGPWKTIKAEYSGQRGAMGQSEPALQRARYCLGRGKKQPWPVSVVW